MAADVDGFLRHFIAFGARPDAERYLRLFHPEATLFDAGMPQPITVPEIPEHIEGILKLVPDFRMTPERWRERAGTLFVEARNTASLGTTVLDWRSVYCMDLSGDRVLRGRRYYDRRALYGKLNPTLPSLPAPEASATPECVDPVEAEPCFDADPQTRRFGEALEAGNAAELVALFRDDATLASPELGRPFARSELPAWHAALHRLLPGLRFERLAFAGDAALCFAEWRVTCGPISFTRVDRLDCAAGSILAARAYFDTLELATRLETR